MADEKSIPSNGDKTARHRSPAWPFIPLAKAVERVREFYKAHRDRAASASAANVAWGMGPKSGAGFQTIATLKQYGLMKEGSAAGSVQLTDVALRIVQDGREVSPDREAALREAAISPPAFADLWRQWDTGLPDDASVEYYLVREKGFSEDVAKRLLAHYKATIQLAKLVDSDSITDSGEGNGAQHRKIPKTPPPPGTPPPPPSHGVKLMEGERIVFTHELEPSHGVRVLASGDVDESMIDALELYIQLQKKRLARQPQHSTSPELESVQAGEVEQKAGKPSNKAQVSFFITNAQKAQLRERGYSDDDIAKMKPAEAHQILGLQ